MRGGAAAILLGTSVALFAAVGLVLLMGPSSAPSELLWEQVRDEAPAALWRRSVIVLRHCPRACAPMTDGMAPGYNALADYAAKPFPAWPVPGMNCLPRGAEIIRNAGQHLQSVVHWPVEVISDGVARDIQSSQELLNGLQVPDPTRFRIDAKHEIFNPFKAGVCTPPTKEEMQKVLEERLHGGDCPVTSDYKFALRELQEKIGHGVAPALDTIVDKVEDGLFQGGARAAHEIALTLLMQMAQGMEIAWGRMTPSQVRWIWSTISQHYFCVQVKNEVVVRGMSNLLSHMLAHLEGGEEDGTVVYAGHGTQIDGLAAALGLQWLARPFRANVTPPGAMLRFELARLTNGELVISAHYDYSTLGPRTADNLYTTQVFFSDGRVAMEYGEFRNLAMSQIDPSCTTKSDDGL